MDDFFLRSGPPAVASEIGRLYDRFRADLRLAGFSEPGERALVAEALTANDRFIGIVAVPHERASVEGFRRIDRLLGATEDEVLALLHRLRALNAAQQVDVQRDASAASRRALISAIVAGALAIAGGLGFAVYAFRLVRDIGERNRRLHALDSMKDDFVASVSHELRTPLTSIRGYLDLVLDGEAGDLTDEQEHFLRVVERNADRLLRVVGDLLFVAQADAGKITLEMEPTDIGQLAREAVEALRPVAADKEIDLTLELGELGELDTDRARLAQVLDNLVSNAVKFTPERGHVTVRTVRHGDSVTSR
jgi:signal transduction histidine kinase